MNRASFNHNIEIIRACSKKNVSLVCEENPYGDKWWTVRIYLNKDRSAYTCIEFNNEEKANNKYIEYIK